MSAEGSHVSGILRHLRPHGTVFRSFHGHNADAPPSLGLAQHPIQHPREPHRHLGQLLVDDREGLSQGLSSISSRSVAQFTGSEHPGYAFAA